MEKNNKILLMAIIIIMIGLVSFNFGELSAAATKRTGGGGVYLANCKTTGSGQGTFGVPIYVPESGVYAKKLNIYDPNGYREETVTISSKSSLDKGNYNVKLACDRNKYGPGIHRIEFEDRYGVPFKAQEFKVSFT